LASTATAGSFWWFGGVIVAGEPTLTKDAVVVWAKAGSVGSSATTVPSVARSTVARFIERPSRPRRPGHRMPKRRRQLI
jgi:hypothetical protein